MIKTRMAQQKEAKSDFYSVIPEAFGSGSDANMWNEALFLVSAGGDTTATLISTVFFYLSRNPECYKSLAQEIRTTFSTSNDIQGTRLSSCVYLRACLNEALRMSPPSSSVLWREQDPENEKPLVIDGHIIPRGTLVSSSLYAMHHNEDYFPDSFAFKPNRWLGDGLSNNLVHEAFGAFSIGSRSCPGKAMAYLESGLIVAKALWFFDFETAPGKLGAVGARKERPGEFEILDIFTARHDGPYLVFHPREGHTDLEGVE